jgi:hypothetical protein
MLHQWPPSSPTPPPSHPCHGWLTRRSKVWLTQCISPLDLLLVDPASLSSYSSKNLPSCSSLAQCARCHIAWQSNWLFCHSYSHFQSTEINNMESATKRANVVLCPHAHMMLNYTLCLRTQNFYWEFSWSFHTVLTKRDVCFLLQEVVMCSCRLARSHRQGKLAK